MLGHCLTVTNVVSGALSAAMPVALWSTGDALAQGFAIITLFVGATYVLLHYYPSRERFLTELTLDPPEATSDQSGIPLLDEDYLILSTIRSPRRASE